MGLYSIPFEVPFLPTLSAWLRERWPNPQDLQQVTVWLPTQRSVREMERQLVRDGCALLPRVLPLNAAVETLEMAGVLELPQHVEMDEAAALLKLCELLDAVEDVDFYTPVQQLKRARTIWGLMQKLAAHKIELQALEKAAELDVAGHWQAHGRVLFEVARQFESYLKTNSYTVPAVAAAARLAALAAHYKNGGNGPVVAAGFADSTPAGMEVIRVISGNPQGYVVLPGYVDGEPEGNQRAVWRMRGELAGDTVTPIAGGAADGVARRLIEAPDVEREVACVTLAVREALHEGRVPVRVVVYDRELAQRIAGHLAAAGIAVADSAGQPAMETPAGTLVLALARVMASPRAVALAELCGHGLVTLGERWETECAALEWHLWRGVAASNWREWQAKADGLWDGVDDDNKLAERYHAPAVRDAQSGWAKVSALGMQEVAARQTLAAWSGVLTALLDKLSGGWRTARGAAEVVTVLDAWTRSELPVPVDGAVMAEMLLGDLTAAKVSTAREDVQVHLWGPLESRLQRGGSLILAGANDGVWPSLGDDPWLSQGQLALLGLTTHDQTQELVTHDAAYLWHAAPHLTVTRSLSSGGGDTVPARWLQHAMRVHADEVAGWKKSGDAVLRWLPDVAPQGARAASAWVLPEGVWPEEWSASLVQDLMACPYKAAAQRVLRLQEPLAFDELPDRAELGLVFHRWLEAFWQPVAGLPTAFEGALTEARRDEAEALLKRLADKLGWHLPLASRKLWEIRTANLIAPLVDAWIALHRDGWEVREVESRHAEAVPDSRITLTAKLDRVDADADGVRRIVDYKTGGVPAAKDIIQGLKPQLPVAAWLLEHGGKRVAAAEFWKLNGYGNAPVEELAVKDLPARVDAVADGVRNLAVRYAAGAPWPAVPDLKEGGVRAAGICERCPYAGVCRFKEACA